MSKGFVRLLEYNMAIVVGRIVLESVFNVSFEEIMEHQDELTEQLEADKMGVGINGK